MNPQIFIRNSLTLIRDRQYKDAIENLTIATSQLCKLVPCFVQIPDLAIDIESIATNLQFIRPAINILQLLAWTCYQADMFLVAVQVQNQLLRLLSRHGIISQNAMFNSIIYNREVDIVQSISLCRRLQMDPLTRARATYELGICYLNKDEQQALDAFKQSKQLGYLDAEHAICELMFKSGTLGIQRAKANSNLCSGKRLYIKTLMMSGFYDIAQIEIQHLHNCQDIQCSQLLKTITIENSVSSIKKDKQSLSESQIQIIAEKYNQKLVQLVGDQSFKGFRINERGLNDTIQNIIRK